VQAGTLGVAAVGINPNKSLLKLSAVPVSNEHRNSEMEATHLQPMEALIEEDMLSFVWLSVADTAIL